MKSWQNGYDLDFLKSLAAHFKDYNSYTLSPFVQVKKNNIADALSKNTFVELGDAWMDVSVSKTQSNITMHGNTVIAKKLKGDVTISKMAGNTATLKKQILSLNGNAFWLYVWAEDASMNKLAEDCGFCRVGPKITSFGEMYAIYYKGEERKFPEYDKAELLSIRKVENIDIQIIESIREKLTRLPQFTNHYSNYNKGKSWSALSLRGYSEDPSFITKPIEMNDAWQKENKDAVFDLQDTSLYNDFSEVRELLRPYGDTVHRVRFMRLKPGGGELERHTDQVDPDSGGSLGKLARLHFPIKTNSNVLFTVWNVEGKAEQVHMNEGECWFLDTRKPHRAVNGGTEERIHLVVDILTEKALHDKLLA